MINAINRATRFFSLAFRHFETNQIRSVIAIALGKSVSLSSNPVHVGAPVTGPLHLLVRAAVAWVLYCLAMGPPSEPSRSLALDKLERKADHLKDTLNVLDRLTGEAGQLLDVLGHTLYELGKLTAPINQRATALTIAQTNVAASKQQIDELLENIDTSRRVCLPPLMLYCLQKAKAHRN